MKWKDRKNAMWGWGFTEPSKFCANPQRLRSPFRHVPISLIGYDWYLVATSAESHQSRSSSGDSVNDSGLRISWPLYSSFNFPCNAGNWHGDMCECSISRKGHQRKQHTLLPATCLSSFMRCTLWCSPQAQSLDSPQSCVGAAHLFVSVFLRS